MKEFKGTPGPWVVDVDGVDARWNIDSIDRVSVAITNQVAADKDWSIRDANTKLIAAAPDLLEALQKMFRAGQKQNWNERYESEMKLARAAINKALGEE